ncbi:MAG: aldehyde dehydrogenase family protein, partial [Candidatus Acidiferrales bacterium]
MTTSAISRIYKNFINGEWVESRQGRTFEDRNPAHSSELIGIFPASSEDDVNDAVDAARAAFAKWRLVPAPRRAEILY